MLDPRRPDFDSTPVSATRARFAYAARAPISADNPPVVSVVTPYFNTGEVFLETAQSVLGQSLQQFEWLIINDASTDAAALRVLEPFRKMGDDPDRPGPRVRVIDHAKNLGLAATRNSGYRLAAADLVFQIDADDLIEPTTLEKCAWRLHSRPVEAFVKGKTVGFGGDRYLWDRGFHDGPAFRDDNLATATAMIRKSTWHAVGGFDETIRHGMEDWDFWLRCAERGLWGGTINEHLDWYRRRANQHADWDNLASRRGRERFIAHLRSACPRVTTQGHWPAMPAQWHVSMESIRPVPPFSNRLARSARRLLLILPWMRMGGADRFNLDLVKCLTQMPASADGVGGGPWEVTVVTTMWGTGGGAGVAGGLDDPRQSVGAGNEWFSEFTRFTPDVFMSHNYVRLVDAPSFLEYVIRSREPEVVMVTNSRLGYQVLPYLRQHCPEPVYVDFNHMEEPWWKNGGHPRTGIGYQDQLDLSITVSRHLKDWMVERGADEYRTEVCYINADTKRWRPEPAWRSAVRAELGIDERTPIALYAARLCAQKQPLIFADVIRRTRDLLEPQWEEATRAFEREHGTYAERRAAFEQRARELEERRARAGAGRSLLDDDGGGRSGVDLATLPTHPEPMGRPATKFVAVVAGDGELDGATRAFCEQHDLVRSGHVTFAGAVTTEAMPGYMAASDVFFLPSKWEGIALSIYEAMSSGLCVLGAEVGGQRELVRHTTGILMPGPDECGSPELEAQGYAYALAGLILNPERRESMGRAGRERILAHFELDHMRDRMLALFAKAAEFREREPRETITPGLAKELAVNAIEFARMDALNEELWAERERLLEIERRQREHERAWRDGLARELAIIENSRAWRAVQRVKALPAYQAYARLRWGENWQTWELKDPPESRLARIRSSRSYKLIQSLKTNPAYGLYARMKYGK